MITRVFVYGTLKEGGKLDRKDFSKRRISVTAATIVGKLYDAGWYPAVKLVGKGDVHGEVHEFKKEDMDFIVHSMDRIEGYDPDSADKSNLYVRRIVVAKSKNGEKMKAYVYEFPRDLPEKQRVKSGAWNSKD